MSCDCIYNDPNDSVFLTALPYGATFLAGACGGTYLAITSIATGSTALAVAGVALAFFGATAFLTTTVTGIYSRNSYEFKKALMPALKTALAVTVFDLIATVSKVALIRLVDEFISSKMRRA